MVQIRGSGGGGGGVRSPVVVDEDDTLASRTTARVLLLVSEGEIQGNTAEPDLWKNIYFDDTPVQRRDGQLSFIEANVELLRGTPSQNPPDDFAFIESETAVGQEVTKNTPVERGFTHPAATSVVVRILIPELWEVYDLGGGNSTVGGTKIEFDITLTSSTGTTQTYRQTIEGKASSAFERSYSLPITGGDWLVGINRVTDDSDNENILRNRTIFQSFTLRIGNQLQYPYTAILAIKIRADQFQSVPTVSALLRGIRVKIPSNYNPADRTYNGFWDGTFQAATYTNNPAWIFYDLLTSERYGVGRYLDASQIDIYSLYAIAQYCDELVPDGVGGVEPRFTCNCYIQNRDDAFNVLNGLASVFRGVLYWSEGLVVTGQDRPSDPVRLYTEANVIQLEGQNGEITLPPFRYSGTARRARHTVAIVSYADPKDRYKTKTEFVEDRAGILRYGYREIEITAFGCTSRGQAQRVGRWTLLTEQLETETVTFRVATEGLLVRPGDVIKIADPLKSGQRFGGRIASATNTTVTLDMSVEAPAGSTLSVLNSTGEQVESPCQGTGFTVAATFGFIPQAESIWILQTGSVAPRLYRVLGIAEQQDGSFEITAILHAPAKYDAVDNNTLIVEQGWNRPAVTPQNISQNSIRVEVS